MRKIISIVILLTNLVLLLLAEQCFDNVNLIVYRGSKKVQVQLADTINNEVEATEIIADNQRIPVLHTGCIINLPELKYITVSYCGLHNIEKSVFLNLPRLRVITITVNNIKVIRNMIFHSLDIVQLKLTGNGIEEIEQNAFYNLTSLEVIDLSRNNLYSLKPEVFFQTNNLRQINLNYNKLLFIYDFFFYDCYAGAPSFDSLIDLSSNNISDIGKNTFKGIFTVDTLLLNDNSIEKIDPNAFRDVKQGGILDLRGNALKKVPKKVLFGPFLEVLFDEDPPPQKDILNVNTTDTSISTGNYTLKMQNDTQLVLSQE